MSTCHATPASFKSNPSISHYNRYRRHWHLAACLLLLACFTSCQGGQQAGPKILVFARANSGAPTSTTAGMAAIRAMGQNNGFVVDTTQNAAAFNLQQLRQYHAVVFLHTTGEALNTTQQQEFKRFIQAGGGFVGIHAAANANYQWPWYGKLVGAYYTNRSEVQQATITTIDNGHPAGKALPATWTHTDAWCQFKTINPNINVLATVNEATQPVAWYHEYDGGRAFYTGLGYSKATYSNDQFTAHLLAGIQYAIGNGQPLNYQLASVQPEENRFNKEVLDLGLKEPMELDLLPGTDPQVLFIERGGNVKLYKPAEKATTVVAKINIYQGHEDGLMGLAVDPAYATNHFIYLYYSPAGNEPVQYLSRFVFHEGVLDMASEVVLLKVPVQRDECCHSAGSIEFGPNGLLYLSTGDNTNPHASNGFNPIDERPGRGPWDAQKSSANTNDLRGKILRIKPEADGTYTIPEGNLFAKDGSQGRPEIYVMGCRNPFRMSIDPVTAYLYWGDVGPDAGENKPDRGPRGYDEINQAKGPGNFGWPYFIANNQPYHDFNFATGQSGGQFNAAKPVNTAARNTGVQALPPAQPALVWYPYAASQTFPLLGSGSRNAMAGPVYRAELYANSTRRFPDYYNGKLLIYDWMRGWMMAVTLNEAGNEPAIEPFLPNMEFNNPMDVLFGPEGDLYMLEYGTIWFASNQDARLVRITYTGGNRQPVARIAANKQVGAAPLQVQFDAAASTDFDEDALTYAWYIDGQQQQSDAQAPAFTFEQPGTYVVKLVVTDGGGKADESEVTVVAGNDPPQVAWQLDGNQTFYWGNTALNYSVRVTDNEDGTLPATTSGQKQIDPKRVSVTMEYLKEGHDITVIAQGHQALEARSRGLIGKALMEGSDCASCHQVNQKSIGPTYTDVAAKYTGQADARNYLAKKIIKGGGGVWGETAMAAHPGITLTEARQIADYILSLAAKKEALEELPLQGQYAFKAHQATGTEGSYVFTATYTDNGNKAIPPLTSTDMKVLRHPKVQAERYSTSSQILMFDGPTEQTPWQAEGQAVVAGTTGKYFAFEQIDLTGILSLSLWGNTEYKVFGGGELEVRLGSPTGRQIGVFELTQAEANSPAQLFQTPVQAVQGRHDVYFVFRTKKSRERKPIAAIDWVYFNRQAGAVGP